MKKKILVTGAAGFIGFHLTKKLLELNYIVIGLDNLNDYYSIDLKKNRLLELGIYNVKDSLENKSQKYDNFSFYKIDLVEKLKLEEIFSKHHFNIVINLAAQAGVRHSINQPEVYIQSNILGYFNILEACRHQEVEHLIYASSSSVYGDAEEMPLSENANVNKPISLYAATKVSNEIMTESYSHLYGLKATGLRFFTVYGPWGRPDMAVFLFTEAILNQKEIKVFNNGDLERDFTYVDDIVGGILPIVKGAELKERARHSIYNIGNSSPVKLGRFISTLEEILGHKAIKHLMPMQPGDVYKTYADTRMLSEIYGYSPQTSVKDGLEKFVSWYKSYNS